MTKVYRNLSSLPLLNNLIIMVLLVVFGIIEKDGYQQVLGIIVLELVVSVVLGLLASRMSDEFKKQALEIKFLLVLSSFAAVGVSYIMYENIALFNKPVWQAITVLVLFIGFMVNLGLAIHLLTLERLYYLNYPEVVTDYKIESKKVAKEALFFLPMCVVLIIVSFFMVFAASGGASV